jgi:pimeloyl-ACP methyl ester carboxylesterase
MTATHSMKALVLDHEDTPFRLATIVRPTSGSGQVLARIKASGDNRLDIKIRRGNAPHVRHHFPASYFCIKAFSETHLTEDLKNFNDPTLILHGDADQIVPIADSALRSSKLVKNAFLKVYYYPQSLKRDTLGRPAAGPLSGRLSWVGSDSRFSDCGYWVAPHGMCTTLKDRVDAVLLAFIRARLKPVSIGVPTSREDGTPPRFFTLPRPSPLTLERSSR